MIRNLDEVTLPNEYDNNLSDFVKYFEEYYSKVPANEERREKRKDVAIEIRDAIILFLLLLREQIERGAVDTEYALYWFRLEFTNVVSNYVVIDDYMRSYIQTETQEILDSTLNNLDKAKYFLSDDRATITAANEGSIVINYAELQKAIEEGYTYKIWVSQRDNRVRHTHIEADGQKKPINDFFIVGGCAMMMPHDPECVEMKEISNCRCCLSYK